MINKIVVQTTKDTNLNKIELNFSRKEKNNITELVFEKGKYNEIDEYYLKSEILYIINNIFRLIQKDYLEYIKVFEELLRIFSINSLDDLVILHIYYDTDKEKNLKLQLIFGSFGILEEVLYKNSEEVIHLNTDNGIISSVVNEEKITKHLLVLNYIENYNKCCYNKFNLILFNILRNIVGLDKYLSEEFFINAYTKTINFNEFSDVSLFVESINDLTIKKKIIDEVCNFLNTVSEFSPIKIDINYRLYYNERHTVPYNMGSGFYKLYSLLPKIIYGIFIGYPFILINDICSNLHPLLANHLLDYLNILINNYNYKGNFIVTNVSCIFSLENKLQKLEI